MSQQGRHAGELISELNGWPACAPVNASPAMLPPPAHDSGLERFATPFLCGSFIRDSSPALIGAFCDPIPLPQYADSLRLKMLKVRSFLDGGDQRSRLIAERAAKASGDPRDDGVPFSQ